MKSTLVRSAAVSDPGNVRGTNEDRVYADDERGIYLVIDGVGGEAGGEHAAAIAEEELLARLERSTGTVESRIREGIALAGKRILEYARRHPELSGMACVLTVAVVSDGDVVVGHVGDTRLYKIRRGALEKVTRDHSPVGAREDAGEISEREAMSHPRRNEIFRDVGSEERLPDDAEFIDIRRVRFEPDSALLMCSDGLTDQVASAEISATVAAWAGDPWVVARELIRRANKAGGKDNVSVVYVEGPAFPKNVKRSAIEDTRAPRPRRLLPAIAAAGLAGIILGALITAGAYRALIRRMPAGPRTLVVEPGAEGAYGTIAAALDAAKAGDTIEIAPGTYRERIELKDGVRMTTRPSGEAVLEPKADASEPGAGVSARDLPSGSLAGLHIRVTAGAGITAGILISGSDVDVAGVEVEGAPSAGIVVRGASNAVIQNSYIHDNPGAGIVVERDAQPRLFANIIANNGNTAGAPRAGVEAAGNARPAIVSNVFANNRPPVKFENAPGAEAEVAKLNVIVGGAQQRPRAAAAERGRH